MLDRTVADRVSRPPDTSSRAPLSNRVDPFGALLATPARGLLMGNRGGRFHRDDRTLGERRWASRQWIACVCEFRGRRRSVWSSGYTELFFLDEPTALGAGHRPCFECRRAQAEAFRAAWAAGRRCRRPPTAGEMDDALHRERLVGRGKRRHIFVLDELPDGAVIAEGRACFAVRGDRLLPWSPQGYGAGVPRPAGTLAEVLTPPAMVHALAHGYRPLWHPSAGAAPRACASGVGRAGGAGSVSRGRQAISLPI